MEAPLKGIRVLEVANWLAIPSCAAMMADMGADVIKVEALQGDTFRTEIRDADFAKSFPPATPSSSTTGASAPLPSTWPDPRQLRLYTSSPPKPISS